MCEFSKELIAWLDQELPAERAANVARHVLDCAACRGEVELYRQLGETFDAYCDRALASKAKRRLRPLLVRPGYLSPAFAAAAVLLFFLLGPVERLRSLFSPLPDGAPAIAFKAPGHPAPAVEKMTAAAGGARKTPKRVNSRLPRPEPLPTVSANRSANWLPDEAPVYIAIPADALFPPGAFPEGVGFVADVNWRPDGSAQRLRLRPQLVGFQTKGTRP
jgi:anti-sigma factor RsiW